MKKLIIMMSVLLMLGSFCACSSSDEVIAVNDTNDSPKEENSPESPQVNDIQEMMTNISTFNIPRKEMNINDMPDWLADHIAQSKIRSKSVGIYFCYYQFEWKESIYYLIMSSYTAWPFAGLYDSKGDKIDLSQSQEEVDNLLAYSSEWYIIYEVFEVE
ncbi:MAG: hypothetical protein K6E15_06800 [Prevotella sp.]|nr:hypothetical protein [Prevotella sp.]